MGGAGVGWYYDRGGGGQGERVFVLLIEKGGRGYREEKEGEKEGEEEGEGEGEGESKQKKASCELSFWKKRSLLEKKKGKSRKGGRVSM